MLFHENGLEVGIGIGWTGIQTSSSPTSCVKHEPARPPFLLLLQNQENNNPHCTGLWEVNEMGINADT